MMVVSLRKTATPKMATAVLIGIRRRALDEKEQQQREKIENFTQLSFTSHHEISPKHSALFTSAPGLFSLSLSLSFVVV
jgi:hypothetical protein